MGLKRKMSKREPKSQITQMKIPPQFDIKIFWWFPKLPLAKKYILLNTLRQIHLDQ